MPRRLRPRVLVSLLVVLILSLALFAGAQTGGGAVGTALGQVGKPYALGTDGPGTFSCTGLVRFALRSIGIMDAPWDHYAYLSAYPNVSKPEPGDVVVYPDGAAMYIGNDQVVMSNHADGAVGTYPMGAIRVPVGFARPTADGTTGGQTPVGSEAPADGEAPVEFEERQGDLAPQGDLGSQGDLVPQGDAMLAEQQEIPIEQAPLVEQAPPVEQAPIEQAPL